MKAPTSIDLSPEAVSQLRVKIQKGQIDAQTQLLLLGLIDFCLWFQFKLSESKISISCLTNLFGLATKKKINNGVAPNDVAVNEETHSSCSANENNASIDIVMQPKKKRKGHGRNSTNDYTGAIIEKISISPVIYQWQNAIPYLFRNRPSFSTRCSPMCHGFLASSSVEEVSFFIV